LTHQIDPAISVVIPAYEAQRYLREAIDSVLRQTLPAVEIIVVDDGSTDDTAKIAQSVAGVTYTHKTNGGVASALNHGIKLATGQYIAFLSADDIWHAEKLQRQMAALAGEQNRLVFGHMQHFISPELSPDEARSLVCPPEPMPANSAGTLLAPLATVRRVGAINEAFAVGEFMEWYGRASDLGIETIMLSDVVSMRRVHENNHSAKTLRTKSYAPVLKAILDRRRAEKANQ
jgi:glycosyltransferase involved in cell wall biosynthesis